ncbi:2-dehydropantoate 2-reductase [Paraburkholderia saeva]|uniref:2-dehydropantoate 2-reductase n=1 Tax=Paraburkholderia saeva TaxID=2777537 RepID=A0A9N8S0A3_9BURK|nr:2-dehydropantoate 2-reductase [Paraburkholderia saeva]CAG4897918.1 2-dehydropantoate 2-reductase [Paraburkholderia saeva]CAG4912298.1 2-dehydropantoate 2-reductase [Paraburkholderia saeva]
MRILVVGAGATGGYFGGRLAAAGRDVTFLVRAQRAEELKRAGLVIRSPRGDLTLRDVKTIQAGDTAEPFDLIVLSCKAYSLDDAVKAFAPFVGPDTAILPLLNGMAHIDTLTEQFGTARVLGGQCVIAATLNAAREIVHLNDLQSITFGELAGGSTERARAIDATLQGAGFDVALSDAVLQQMWAKWVFLSTLAASTCLFRASIGEILAAPDGKRLIEGLLSEGRAVSAHNGYPLGDDFVARVSDTLFAAGSPLTASMLRDVENRSRIEADHILGDLIRRGGAAQHDDARVSLLRLAYNHLKAYEARQAREA